MLLHLKAGDGDLLLITEPALLSRCAWQLHLINRAALHTQMDRIPVEKTEIQVWRVHASPFVCFQSTGIAVFCTDNVKVLCPQIEVG